MTRSAVVSAALLFTLVVANGCGPAPAPASSDDNASAGSDNAATGSTAATAACTTDADCRTFADYCTGCDCRALAQGEADPVCSGLGVRCFADPCMQHTAACDAATHACVVR